MFLIRSLNSVRNGLVPDSDFKDDDAVLKGTGEDV